MNSKKYRIRKSSLEVSAYNLNSFNNQYFKFLHHMQKISLLLLALLCVSAFNLNFAQIIWSESFGSGCDPEIEADGYTSANGTWTVSAIGNNGNSPNTWYIGAEASAQQPGDCSNSCSNAPALDGKTLHIGTHPTLSNYEGATYDNSADAITSTIIASPPIDLSSNCNVELSFEYLHGGNDLTSKATVAVFDGQDFYSLPEITQSEFCELFGAEWRTYNAILPQDVYFQSDIQIIFLWENETDGSPENISFAVNNISLKELPIEAPEISCPTNQTFYVDEDCNYSIIDFAEEATVSDDCYSLNNLTITQTPSVGTNIMLGENTVILMVENPSSLSSSCNFEITVLDTISPVIQECPPSQELFYDADCVTEMEDFSSLVIASDNCTSLNDMVISQTPSPGTTIGGSLQVIMNVADASGNSVSCNFDLEVIDTIKPELDCPADVTVYYDESCDALIPDLSQEVIFSDNCSTANNLIYEQVPAVDASVFGVTEIQVSITDEANNTKICTVALEKFDTIAPVIVCPIQQNFNLGLDCDVELTDLTVNALVGENCSTWSIDQSPAIGSVLTPGITEVTLTVSDSYGNQSSCIVLANVFENINPTIQCPEDIFTCEPLVTYPDPIGDDNCGDFTIDQVDNSGLSSGDIFPEGTTTQMFEVIDPSGNKNTCSFQITVDLNAQNAVILTPDTEICDTSSIFLQAQEPFTGTGEWSISEGNASLNNEFANETGVNNLSNGLNQFIWTVTSPSCGVSSDTVNVILYRLPLPASTVGDQFLCNDTIVNIAASAPSAGQGLWYSLDEEISIVNPNAAATQAYNFSPGWNTIFWEISNGTCPVSTDTLRVYYGAKSTVLTEDTTLCLEVNSIFVDAGFSIPGAFSSWTISEGSGNIEQPLSSATTISNLAGGTNVIVFSQSHGFCPTTRDTVIVEVEVCNAYSPVIPTVFTPNNDGKNDLFVVDQLHNLYPFCEVKIVNRWGNLVYESVGYERPWDGTRNNNGEPMPLGTYFYRIRLNDGSGEELSGSISIVR